MSRKVLFTPKMCSLCGRPITKPNYVRFAPAGSVDQQRDQQDLRDAQEHSQYFHQHCYVQYKKQWLEDLKAGKLDKTNIRQDHTM